MHIPTLRQFATASGEGKLKGNHFVASVLEFDMSKNRYLSTIAGAVSLVACAIFGFFWFTADPNIYLVADLNANVKAYAKYVGLFDKNNTTIERLNAIRFFDDKNYIIKHSGDGLRVNTRWGAEVDVQLGQRYYENDSIVFILSGVPASRMLKFAINDYRNFGSISILAHDKISLKFSN